MVSSSWFVLGRRHPTSFVVDALVHLTIFVGRLPLDLVACHYPEWFKLVRWILRPVRWPCGLCACCVWVCDVSGGVVDPGLVGWSLEVR